MSNHFKLCGLLVYPIILDLKYKLNFLKGNFIPCRLFSGSGGLSGAILGAGERGGGVLGGHFSVWMYYIRILCMDVLWLTLNMNEAFSQYALLQAFFLISHTFTNNAVLKLEKMKQMLSNTLILNF